MTGKNVLTTEQVQASKVLDEAAATAVSLKLASEGVLQLGQFARDAMNSGYWPHELTTADGVAVAVIDMADRAVRDARRLRAALRKMGES